MLQPFNDETPHSRQPKHERQCLEVIPNPGSHAFCFAEERRRRVKGNPAKFLLRGGAGVWFHFLGDPTSYTPFDMNRATCFKNKKPLNLLA